MATQKSVTASVKQVLVKGNNVRLCIVEINGKEYGAHVFGLDPIARDAGRVTTTRNGQSRQKSTNTVAKYDRANLTFTHDGKIVQTGFWAGQPAMAQQAQDDMPDSIDF